MKRLCESCPKCPQPVMSHVQLMDHQLAMMLRCIQIENARTRPKTTKVFRPKDWLPPLHPYDSKLISKNLDGDINTNEEDEEEHNASWPIIGLMMDKPGTGKTFVMLSMVLADIERRKLTRPRDVTRETTIVVVPGHIYHQWWQAMLQVFRTHSVQDASEEESTEPVRWTKVRDEKDCVHLQTLLSEYDDEFDIILVHMNCYQSATDIMAQKGLFPKRLVIDEADGLQASTYIDEIMPCKTVWLVSGTMSHYIDECTDKGIPFEYAGLTIQPDKLHENAVLCDDVFVAQNIQLHEPDERYIICRDELVDSCFLYARQDALDKINALQDPVYNTPIYDMNSFVAGCIAKGYINPLIKQITKTITYNVPIDNKVIMHENNNEQEHNEHKINKIRTAACYYGLPGDTSIYKSVNISLPDTRAPIEPLFTTHTRQVTEECELDIMTIESNSKVGALTDIVKGILGARVQPRILIASMYDATLEIVAKVLDSIHVPWKTLHIDNDNNNNDDNANDNYEESLLMYHRGDVEALLINATTYGNGLNLQCTTDLIMMHAMPKNIQVQVVGRAQRPGRQGQLLVWNLVHINEEDAISSNIYGNNDDNDNDTEDDNDDDSDDNDNDNESTSTYSSCSDAGTSTTESNDTL